MLEASLLGLPILGGYAQQLGRADDLDLHKHGPKDISYSYRSIIAIFPTGMGLEAMVSN